MSDSWDLKLDRAEQHLAELAAEVQRFTDRHPYEAVPQPYADDGRQFLRFVLRFTEQPSELLAVIAGDVVHNIRSALDHLVVANVPEERRKFAGFPIFWTCPFDAEGKVRSDRTGRAWTRCTTGLPPLLLRQVEMLQPYRDPAGDDREAMRARGIDPDDVHALGNIGRFDNADKHQALLAVPYGVHNPDATVRVRDEVRGFPVLDGVIKDGGQIAVFDMATFPPGSEVELTLNGRVCVALEVHSGKGVLMLPAILDQAITHARSQHRGGLRRAEEALRRTSVAVSRTDASWPARIAGSRRRAHNLRARC